MGKRLPSALQRAAHDCLCDDHIFDLGEGADTHEVGLLPFVEGEQVEKGVGEGGGAWEASGCFFPLTPK